MGKRLTIKERLERKFKKAPKEIQKYQNSLKSNSQEQYASITPNIWKCQKI